VFANCIQYNGRTTNYGVMASKLSDELENLIDENNLRRFINKE